MSLQINKISNKLKSNSNCSKINRIICKPKFLIPTEIVTKNFLKASYIPVLVGLSSVSGIKKASGNEKFSLGFSEKEIAEKKYEEDCLKIAKELQAKEKTSQIRAYLEGCSFINKKGYPVFSKDLRLLFEELKCIFPHVPNENLNSLLSKAYEIDENDNVVVNANVFTAINLLKAQGNDFSEIEDIVNSSKNDGVISEEALNFATEYSSSCSSFFDECIKNCFDKDGFNKDMANLYGYLFKEKVNFIHLDEVISVMVENKDGKKIVKPISILENIINETKKEAYKRKIQSLYRLKDILDCDCKVEDYLKYYDLAKSNYGDKFLIASRIPSIVSVAICKKPDGQSGYVEEFDSKMIDVLKKYENLLIFQNDGFEEVDAKRIAIAKLINACKVLDPYKGEYFDENIMQKALLLRKKGIPLYEEKQNIYNNSPIAEIINSCKISIGSETKFDYQIFDRVLTEASENSLVINNLLKVLKFSKEYNSVLKKESFNLEAFDLYYKFCQAKSNYNFDNILKKNQKIDMDNLRFCSEHAGMELNVFIDYYEDEKGNPNRRFNIEAVKALREINDTGYKDSSSSVRYLTNKQLLKVCYDQLSETNTYFNPQKLKIVIKFLNKGIEPKEVINTFSKLSLEQMAFIEKLAEDGIDIVSARSIVSACFDKSNKIREDDLTHCLELYNLGMREGDISRSIKLCYDTERKSIGIMSEKRVFNEQAFARTKELFLQNLPIDLINVCKDNNVFKDRLYLLLMNLKEQNYPINELFALMNACKNKKEVDLIGNKVNYFDKKIYDKIFELEKIGINKSDIAKILESCKYDEKFSAPAAEKILELHNKNYDSSGIEKILSNSSYDKNNFSQARYEELLELTQYHKRLKNMSNPNDGLVIKKLLDYENFIQDVKAAFGEDILVYATSARVDNYISFVKNCRNILANNSTTYVNELIKRVFSLPSPELKVKRLQILGALSDKVDEVSLNPLVNKIESPKMSERQVDLVNEIFTDDSKTYEEQMQEFIRVFDVPNKNKKYLTDYLAKAQLDKQIQRPETIENQMKQMEIFAQQMLTNPKIPLEKKIKYIEEYNSKRENMLANPEKYTSPRIYSKALNDLQKVIEAYINIPNSDINFNNAITETMYRALNIEPDKTILEAIQYDAKYFDKLFSSTQGFRNNFKALIELVKLNPNKKLSEMRMFLPNKNSKEEELYEQFDLIKQIEANLDTRKQFEESGLDFEKWNNSIVSLEGEMFNVENDSAILFQNLKGALIKEFRSESVSKISKEEMKKMFKTLEDCGFALENNNFSFYGEELTISNFEKLIDKIGEYLNTSDYFKSAIGKGNANLPDEEKNSATAFIDHIKGFKKKFEDLKNAKSFSNVRLRLADFDNIGRNIFFGNHVGCCNSVDSSYAGYSAPQHLLNSYVRGLEIIDEYGNSCGNSLCYFANIDGKSSFVIDSFEATGKLASNPIVTQNIIKFAKQICLEIGCSPENIYFGENYTNLDLSKLKKVRVDDFKVLGSVSDMAYCDVVGGRALDEINTTQHNINLYSLYEV